jgi:tRNA A-37 threonylcarbamoyl transferase component Bud32
MAQHFLLKSGTRAGRYQLVRPIGSGGSSAVYEAIDPSLGRRVAVKVRLLPEEEGAETWARTRFLREARASSQLQHPNVVSVYDFGIEDGLAYLVMQLVEGETLAHRLKRFGAQGVVRALDLLLPIVSAIAHLHASGIVHRDIKPANILLGQADLGGAKLTDFGLSRFVEEDTMTESGVTLGTPEYMAPEATRAARETSEASDQYSLGVVLYECLTGVRPFSGQTIYELMHAVVSDPVTPPSVVASDVPPSLDAIILRAMDRDPERRFASVEELGAALLPFASDAAVARWQGEARWLEAPSLTPPSSRTVFRLGNGVAVAEQGDTWICLWEAPARMAPVRWAYDAAERFAEGKPGGILALIVLLPSAAPPDAPTMVEIATRLSRLRPVTRRQATVAVGGGAFGSVVRSVHRAIGYVMGPRKGRMTLSPTIEEAIGLLVDRAGPDTPSYDAIADDVCSLYAQLGLEPPVLARPAPSPSCESRLRKL